MTASSSSKLRRVTLSLGLVLATLLLLVPPAPTAAVPAGPGQPVASPLHRPPALDGRVAQGEPQPPTTPPPEEIPPPALPDGPITVPYAPVRFRVKGLHMLPETGELEGADETGARMKFRVLSPRIPMFRPNTSIGRLETLGKDQWADVACVSPPGTPRVAVAVICPDPAPNTPMVCLRQTMGATVVTMNTDRERMGVRDFLYHLTTFTYTGVLVIGPNGDEVGVDRLRPNQVVDLFWKDSPAPQVLFAIRIVK